MMEIVRSTAVRRKRLKAVLRTGRRLRRPAADLFFSAGSLAISTTEQILERCSLPIVIGLKFTDYNFYKLSEVKRSCAVVYNCYDEVLAAGLLMGSITMRFPLFAAVKQMLTWSGLSADQCWRRAAI